MKKKELLFWVMSIGLAAIYADEKIKDGSGTGLEELGLGDDVLVEIERKRDRVKKLMAHGVQIFNENSLARACNLMMYAPDLREGESYLWLDAIDGTSIVSHDPQEIWSDIGVVEDDFGFYSTRELIKKALAGGGWYTYRWHNATKTGYVQLVEKDGKQYELGAAYYASSKAEDVISLVKGGVAFFSHVLEDGFDKEIALGALAYPRGAFIFGDLYLFVLDENGKHLVNGENSGLVGSSGWHVKDAQGKFYIQEIITRLKDKPVGEGIWVQYSYKNASKVTYAERIVDNDGKSYFIASGFYPDITRDAVVNLVAQGYRYLKTYGKTAAKDAFTYESVAGGGFSEFVYGDLNLFLIDFNGICVAFGNTPELVGKNLLSITDESGRFIFKEFIDAVRREDRVWSGYKKKNAFWSAYLERVDFGYEHFVIGCGFCPNTKKEAMPLMVSAAAAYLKNNEDRVAFGSFVNTGREYIRGDLKILTLDWEGTCYTWGDDYTRIWRNLSKLTDQQGKLYVQEMIDAARQVFGVIGTKENNSIKTYFVESVIKPKTRYIIGSGYYP
jgi:signal transduction histidine kinase